MNNLIKPNNNYVLTIPDGSKYHKQNGVNHRLDGPAVEYPDGTKLYYIRGIKYSFEEWNRLRKLEVFK
jgi:hypothetical protein